jgi:hypothetical protein
MVVYVNDRLMLALDVPCTAVGRNFVIVLLAQVRREGLLSDPLYAGIYGFCLGLFNSLQTPQPHTLSADYDSRTGGWTYVSSSVLDLSIYHPPGSP